MAGKLDICFDVDKKIFFSEYLYKKPYLFKRAFQKGSVSWEQISEIYERADAADRNFKLMNGYEVPKQEYLESYVNVGRLEHRYIKPVVYDYMRKGATLVYNRIRNEPLVSDLARQVAQYAAAQVITSGYAAFSAKSSYHCHWDTRDVFAVQLKGKKRWILKEPNFELPLYMQQTKDMPGAKEPEEVYWDVVIEEGDVLYVPRGWWHNPLPMDGETFHLAIGTFAPTGFDYLNWLMRLAPTMLDGRRNLHGYEESRESLESFGREFGELVANQKVFEQFMADYLGQHRLDSRISLGVLGNGKVERLADTQQIRLNANLLYCFAEGFLLVNGNKLDVDEISRQLIEYLYERRVCTVSEVLVEFSDHQGDKLHGLLFELGLNDVIELVEGGMRPSTEEVGQATLSAI